jgi:5-(carboxyamino)imidazole ribonucleotide synthase
VNEPILPGSIVGVLGSGQLGRMFAIAARRMGYRVHVLSPDDDTPTGQVADVEVQAPYDDLDAVRAFASRVQVVTFEFENVPAATASAAAECAPVRPAGRVLHISQNRAREKQFLADLGLPVTPFALVGSWAELDEAVQRLGTPAVLKTARFGYDGKGQWLIDSPDATEAAWQAAGGEPAIVESFIRFERELSVVAARGLDGTFVAYEAVENRHARHILDVTIAPADIPPRVSRDAEAIARAVVEALDVVGVLCVEFFLTRDHRLLINELAPRPHNSGHHTIDSCGTSQFEQQLRAVCGLPLGSARALAPAAMVNLLGDLWERGEPAWTRALALDGVRLHLYGKKDARPGRKMGHITALGATRADAVERALAARAVLAPDPASGARHPASGRASGLASGSSQT